LYAHYGNKFQFTKAVARKIVGARLVIGSVVCVFLALLAQVFLSPYVPQNNNFDTPFYTLNNAGAGTQYRGEIVETRHDVIAHVRLLDGPNKNSVVQVELVDTVYDRSPGSPVLVSEYSDPAGERLGVSDNWRLPQVFLLAAVFFALTYIVAGKRGARSIGALLATVSVLTLGVVPALLTGVSPVVACLVGALVIAILSIFITQGFSKQSVIALICVSITLVIAAVASTLALKFSYLFGMLDEASSFVLGSGNIDTRGLLAGSVVLVTLGVVDDVVVTQVGAVRAVRKLGANSSEAFASAMQIGREHIGAIVNTLVLAYVGVSLPLLVAVASTSETGAGILSLLNSPFIAQEIVRTIVSSIVLVAAVPLSSWAAVRFLTPPKNS